MSDCDHEEKYRDGMCLECWTKWILGQEKMLTEAIEGWRSALSTTQSERDQARKERDTLKDLLREAGRCQDCRMPEAREHQKGCKMVHCCLENHYKTLQAAAEQQVSEMRSVLAYEQDRISCQNAAIEKDYLPKISSLEAALASLKKVAQDAFNDMKRSTQGDWEIEGCDTYRVHKALGDALAAVPPSPSSPKDRVIKAAVAFVNPRTDDDRNFGRSRLNEAVYVYENEPSDQAHPEENRL